MPTLPVTEVSCVDATAAYRQDPTVIKPFWDKMRADSNGGMLAVSAGPEVEDQGTAWGVISWRSHEDERAIFNDMDNFQKMFALTAEYVPNPPRSVNMIQFRQGTEKAVASNITEITFFKTKSEDGKQKLLKALEQFAANSRGEFAYGEDVEKSDSVVTLHGQESAEAHSPDAQALQAKASEWADLTTHHAKLYPFRAE